MTGGASRAGPSPLPASTRRRNTLSCSRSTAGRSPTTAPASRPRSSSTPPPAMSCSTPTPGEHRLRRGVRKPPPPRLPGARLRRFDVRDRRGDRAGIRRPRSALRHRRQRRGHHDGLDRRQDRSLPSGGGRQAGGQLIQQGPGRRPLQLLPTTVIAARPGKTRRNTSNTPRSPWSARCPPRPL